jgi:hypothetical protein
MTNRLQTLFEEPEEKQPDEDYYEIRTDCEIYYVSPATAAQVSTQLTRCWPRRWLRFRDLAGAEVLVRSRRVEAITECTGAQRAAERSFRRAARRKRPIAGRGRTTCGERTLENGRRRCRPCRLDSFAPRDRLGYRTQGSPCVIPLRG